MSLNSAIRLVLTNHHIATAQSSYDHHCSSQRLIDVDYVFPLEFKATIVSSLHWRCECFLAQARLIGPALR